MEPNLQFGIPSVDSLFEGTGGLLGDEPPPGERPESLSVCIVGADGTGKSVLALHLASTYSYRCKQRPFVFYATTDLSYRRASSIWKKFNLHLPTQREYPFPIRPLDLATASPAEASPPELKLVPYAPLRDEAPTLRPDQNVYLVDLASTTAGDDWGLLNRLLSGLAEPEREGGAGPFGPCHLLVIDAVEGLETLVGDKDAFGEERSRRSRIAQLLRTAKEKCHVVLIVEESGDGTRQPEEFVTDVVLRLRYQEDRNYVRRSLEVEKARGQSHARGQHDFAIRSKEGSKTQGMVNPDDPPVSNDYFVVFPSLHYLSRKEMRSGNKETSFEFRCTGFGIDYLDNMLGEDSGGKRGLPNDAPTALIGEDGTFKSHLGRAFLAQCFHDSDRPGVAVLLTTKNIDQARLAKLLPAHLAPPAVAPPEGAARLRAVPEGRVLCRKLEIHHLSASVLMHIVQRLVEKAQSILFEDEGWKCEQLKSW